VVDGEVGVEWRQPGQPDDRRRLEEHLEAGRRCRDVRTFFKAYENRIRRSRGKEEITLVAIRLKVKKKC
jgi:hypothetical protein